MIIVGGVIDEHDAGVAHTREDGITYSKSSPAVHTLVNLLPIVAEFPPEQDWRLEVGGWISAHGVFYLGGFCESPSVPTSWVTSPERSVTDLEGSQGQMSSPFLIASRSQSSWQASPSPSPLESLWSGLGTSLSCLKEGMQSRGGR